MTAPETLPSGLSMLWEPVDPAAALRERFGFDDLEAVGAWVSTALDRTWDVGFRSCSRAVISGPNAIVWVTTDRGDLVIKWSRAQERFGRLDAATRLLRAVAERGVPVAAPVATADGLDRVELDGPTGPLSVTVLPELAGDWLDVGDPAAVRSAGACLARLHRALGGIPVDTWSGPSVGPGLTEHIRAWLATGDRGFAPAASRRLAGLVVAAPPLPDERQLVHNDFRAANVLTRDSTVVGVLDFDEVQVAHPVLDLAKASVYLATRFTDWRPTSPAVRRLLRDGYASVRPLSAPEAEWYEILVLWQGLLAIPGEDDPGGWGSADALASGSAED